MMNSANCWTALASSINKLLKPLLDTKGKNTNDNLNPLNSLADNNRLMYIDASSHITRQMEKQRFSIKNILQNY